MCLKRRGCCSPNKEKEPGTDLKGSAKLFFLWYNIIAKPLNQRKDCTTKMRNCQVRLNMNYEICCKIGWIIDTLEIICYNLTVK